MMQEMVLLRRPSSANWQAADNIGYSNVSSLQSFHGSRWYNEATHNTMGDEIICTDPNRINEHERDGDMKIWRDLWVPADLCKFAHLGSYLFG
jgi:hypothetical protein